MHAGWAESAHAAVRRLEEERDTLLREKAGWLSRISEDNTKLATVLKVGVQLLMLFLAVSVFNH
jgi:hypothetical protein